MEVLVPLLALAFLLSGPIAILLLRLTRKRVRELEKRLARLERGGAAAPAESTSTAPATDTGIVAPPASPLAGLAPIEPGREPRVEEREPNEERERRMIGPAPVTPIVMDAPSIFAKPANASRRTDDWEQFIGGALLNRLGIALLVLGIAFALGYSFQQLGPAGKSALSTVVSVALIATGCVLERKPRYTYQARGLIAGGWAALYVTAYAMHGVDATRIVDDVRLGFAILLVVATGMIVHSLRYRLESVTAIAYSLAYAAIVVHSVHTFTVVASIVLGAGTVLHLLRRGWYGIAIGGIVASYGSIVLWYQRQALIDEPTLRVALAAIGVNWLVFLVADYFAKPAADDAMAGARARLAAHMNGIAAILLATFVYFKSTVAGHYAPSLVIGVLYAISAVIATLRSHAVPKSVHTILAALALGYAAWLGMTLEHAAWFWLAEAEVLLLLGLYRHDAPMRRFGALGFLAPLFGVVIAYGEMRAITGDGAFDREVFLFTIVAIGCFYHAFTRLREFASQLPDGAPLFDDLLIALTSWGAFSLVLLSLWVQLPNHAVAPAVAVLALVLFEVAARRKRFDLRLQSNVASALAMLAGWFVTRPSNALSWVGLVGETGIRAAIPSVSILAAALYAIVWRSGRQGLDPAYRMTFGKIVHAAAATFLLTWMIDREARAESIGPIYAVIALVLLEAGIRRNEPDLRRPAYWFCGGTFVALLAYSVGSTAVIARTEVGVDVTTVSLALFVLAIVWWRVRQLPRSEVCASRDPLDEFCGRIVTYCFAPVVFALLMHRFHNPLMHDTRVLQSIPFFVLVFFTAGTLLRDADLRLQGYLVVASLLFVAQAIDWGQSDHPLRDLRQLEGLAAFTFYGVTVLLVSGALLRWRNSDPTPDRRTCVLETAIAKEGANLLFLAAFGMAAIYAARTQSGFAISVAWAIEGLLATALGFVLKSRPLRAGGLGLLALAVFLTLARALSTFDTIGRIVSFLVLGVILVGLSLVYARRRGTA